MPIPALETAHFCGALGFCFPIHHPFVQVADDPGEPVDAMAIDAIHTGIRKILGGSLRNHRIDPTSKQDFLKGCL